MTVKDAIAGEHEMDKWLRTVWSSEGENFLFPPSLPPSFITALFHETAFQAEQTFCYIHNNCYQITFSRLLTTTRIDDRTFSQMEVIIYLHRSWV